MKVVVTGATGFVGTALVRELVAAGHAVTALTRDVERAARAFWQRCAATGNRPSLKRRHSTSAPLRCGSVLCSAAAVLRAAFGEMSAVLLASQRVQPRLAQQLGFAFRYPTLRSALDDLCADPSHELIIEQRLARRPELVFPFFSDPANLEKITPAFLRFRVRGTTTAQIGNGTLINYELRLHGIPLRWQSRIDAWEPNRKFVDTQTRGPYTLWHHTHEFEPDDGGTPIRDRVRYRLPFGALGDLIAGWMVRRDLEAVFDFRRRRIQELIA